MNVFEALLMGASLSLLQFASLWLAITRGPSTHTRPFQVARIAHLGLIGVAFFILAREGPYHLLAGLGGWLAIRGYLLARLGGAPFLLPPPLRGTVRVGARPSPPEAVLETNALPRTLPHKGGWGKTRAPHGQ